MPTSANLLNVQHLRLHFHTRQGTVHAVDDVSFSMGRQKALVIIGESGSGKSSLARGLLRLLPRNVRTYSGRVLLQGQDIMTFSDERFRKEVRWTRLSFVSQAAMNALNPVVKVSVQVAEPLLVHGQARRKADALAKARDVFQAVGVPLDFTERYPFELSGGMRQRVAIAMALVTFPDLVVMDEPTSALDVLTQANLMNVLKDVKGKFGTGFLMITHDIATASEIADDLAVMYAGQLIEHAPANQFLRAPLHPYSKKLLATVPSIKDNKTASFIEGDPPSLLQPPTGCRFAPRCPARWPRCNEEPPSFTLDDGRTVKCWLYEGGTQSDDKRTSAVGTPS